MFTSVKLKSKCLITLFLMLLLLPSLASANSTSYKIDIIEYINSQDEITVINKTGKHVYYRMVDEYGDTVFIENINSLMSPRCCPEYDENPKQATYTVKDLVYIEDPDYPGGGTWVRVTVKITVCYYCGYEICRRYS